uniref:Uncharacterized protein n=1 Tax=Leersia perrieri TaxID=77586 RepID=A0A0D9VLD3_9ORYZ
MCKKAGKILPHPDSRTRPQAGRQTQTLLPANHVTRPHSQRVGALRRQPPLPLPFPSLPPPSRARNNFFTNTIPSHPPDRANQPQSNPSPDWPDQIAADPPLPRRRRSEAVEEGGRDEVVVASSRSAPSAPSASNLVSRMRPQAGRQTQTLLLPANHVTRTHSQRVGALRLQPPLPLPFPSLPFLLHHVHATTSSQIPSHPSDRANHPQSNPSQDWPDQIS